MKLLIQECTLERIVKEITTRNVVVTTEKNGFPF